MSVDGNGVPLQNIPGSQEPTFRLAPPYASTKGGAVARICELAGEQPDDWHFGFWDDVLGVDEAGDWTATTAEVELARRNSKTWPVHRLALARMLILDGPPVVWTSYRGDAALKAFAEMGTLIDSSRWFRNRLKQTISVNGMQGYVFKNAASISYRTRKAAATEAGQGGRSLEAGLLVNDEDQDFNDESEAALSPLTATIPGAQTVNLGSAGHQGSTVKGRLLAEAAAGKPRLVCLRWAATEDDDLKSEVTWARHLPALNNHRSGRKLTSQTIADRWDKPRFAREWMSIGDYPRSSGSAWVIAEALFRATTDPRSAAAGQLVWSLEVAHDLESAAISVAGYRSDGAVHVETVRHRLGHRWAVPELVELMSRHPTLGVALNLRGATGSVRGQLADAGVAAKTTLLDLGSNDQAEAFSSFYAAFREPLAVRHRGALLVERAFAAAKTRRNQQGATTWSAVAAAEDITPVLSQTWAYHGLKVLGRQVIRTAPPPMSLLVPTAGRATLGVDLASVAF